MPSPRLEPLVLTDEERLVLAAWSRRRKTAQALAVRSRAVLRCAEGGTLGQVAADHPGRHERRGAGTGGIGVGVLVAGTRS